MHKPTKRTEAIKAKIIELYQAQPRGKKTKAEIGHKVNRSRAYVYQVLIKAKVIKKQTK